MAQTELVMTTESDLLRILDTWFAPHKSEIYKKIETEISGVLEIVHDLAEHMDARFNALEKDVAQLKTDVAELKTDVSHLKSDVKQLQTNVIRLDEKFDKVALQNDIQDGHLARHERWHYQAAQKLHIKLT